MQNLASTPISNAVLIKREGKKRGGYSCGRCGLPKKGHICNFTTPSNPNPTPTPNADHFSTPERSPARSPAPATQLRRSLTFDGMEVEKEKEEGEKGCLWEVLRRLMPKELMLASGVSREWRETASRIWAAAEEVRVRVPEKAPIGFIGSVLQKCTSLVRLSLIMERCGFVFGGLCSF